MLVEHVLELGTGALVAGGAQIGDVVGDDVDRQLLGQHAARAGIE
jgi:hypothetical protein